MSYFDNLSTTSQDLIMLNFEFLGKKLLLGIALAFSIYYIFLYWKSKKESPYLLTGIIRMMLYICSWVCMTAFPLMIFFLYPQVELDRILMFMLIFYTVAFFVVSTIVTLNIFYYGTHFIASFANIKVDAKVEKVRKKTIGEVVKLLGIKWKD